MPKNRTGSLLLVGLLILLMARAPVWGDEFDARRLQADVLKTIERVQPSVVLINGRGSSFSGVIVTAEGHVLSAGHAVEPGARYRIALPDGRRLRGVGKGSNPQADAALILITDPPADLPHVPMGDSTTLVTHQPCIGLSYPGGQLEGQEPVARFGCVVRSSTRRGMLQSTALMEPGDSGGPLFDLNGCVIGIHSRIGLSMERNYEVPIETYRKFWNELNREQMFIESGPPRPMLGVQVTDAGERAEGPAGLRVVDVVEKGLAEKGGIKDDDTLVEVYDRELNSVRDLQDALIAARDEAAETIDVSLIRDGERVELNVVFDVVREAAPHVPLPSTDRPDVPAPQGFQELARFARTFSELEASLDDACVAVTSSFAEDATRTIVGTRVLGTPWVVSKSSEVGDGPAAAIDGETVELVVVSRDAENDLVLLQAPRVHEAGVSLEGDTPDVVVGSFVLTPDGDGEGMVSVLGTPAFRSRKLQSRGFLGVVPGTYGKNEGAILNEVTEDGAAKRAGLLVGDIIKKLNDTMIRTQSDLRNFLAGVDPNAVITATLLRDEEEIIKPVTLGSVPAFSNHAADQIEKSGRRDGFAEVISHDADLKPDDCGSPVFTLDGEFLGLNIARNSRVRSYLLTADVLREFVEEAAAGSSQ